MQESSCPRCRKKIPADARFCPYCGADLLKPKKKKPRRPNGAGSVTRCSDRRAKPWRARISFGNRAYTVGYFETSSDAMKAIAVFRPPDDSAAQESVTLGAVYEIILREKEKDVTESTLNTYRCAWEKLLPLAEKPLSSLKPADYQRIIDGMTGAARSTCAKVRVLISQIGKWAVANGILQANPGQYVKLPKQRAKSPDERNTFTLDEINALWQDETEAAHITLAMIYTGMRINELFSLAPEDAHLDEDGYSFIVGGEKTEAGRNRVIVLHDRIVPFFRRWKDAGHKTLIVNKSGGRMTALNFRANYYYPLLDRLGIPKMNPHKTRHTFASMEANAGADPATLQKLLGHANFATTANVYHHADLAALKKAIDLLP